MMKKLYVLLIILLTAQTAYGKTLYSPVEVRAGATAVTLTSKTITLTSAYAAQICDEVGANCKDISGGWGSGGDITKVGLCDTGDCTGDFIDGTDLVDDASDSEHYTNGSIDAVHLAADIIDETKIADNGIDSEHYNDDSIDDAHPNWGTGANQISAGDIPILDTDAHFELTTVEGALAENGYYLTDITDDVALKKYTVASGVWGSVWTITVTENFGDDLEFNIDRVHYTHSSDVMTVDATALAGTDANPKTVFVYVYNNGGTATLAASNTDPDGVLEHVHIADYKAGAVGASSRTRYAGHPRKSYAYEFIAHAVHKFWDDGTRYNSGIDITGIATDITLTAGNIQTIFTPVTTTALDVSTDGLYHIKNDNSFESKTDFAFTEYSSGESITANKYYNVVLGVVQDAATRIMALVQKGDTIPGGKEYKNVKEAVEDKYGTLVTSPSDTMLKNLFVPIARVVVYNDGSDELQEIPESGTSIYAIDLRGSSAGGGGSVATAGAPSDADYWVGTANADLSAEQVVADEAGLYAALSDVSDFVQAAEANSIDSAMYVDGSIDLEHHASTVNIYPKTISRTANYTLAVSDTYNTVIYMSGISTLTVPAVQDSITNGTTQLFNVVAGGPQVITIDVDGSDVINLSGVDLSAGDSIDSSGAKWEEVSFMAAADEIHWIVKEVSPTWVDGN